jgi:hypothetical protein
MNASKDFSQRIIKVIEFSQSGVEKVKLSLFSCMHKLIYSVEAHGLLPTLNSQKKAVLLADYRLTSCSKKHHQNPRCGFLSSLLLEKQK